MKKSLAFGACVIAALTLNTQAQNLLTDPSFENGALEQPNPIVTPGGVGGGWAGFGATISSAAAHTGVDSASLADNSWGPTGVYQIVAVTPGVDYTASAWFDNTGAASGFTPFIVNLQWDDATGNQLAGSTTASTGWSAETLNSWEQLTCSGVAPAGTVYASVYLMAMDNVVNGAQYFADDASLTAPSVPEPTTLALLGLGVVGGVIWRRRQ